MKRIGTRLLWAAMVSAWIALAPATGAAAGSPPTVGNDTVVETQVSDPIEPFNRAMFQLNDTLYFWLFKPVAQGYGYIVPEEVRILVRNFFYNLNMPVRMVNNLLQAKPIEAGQEVERFVINTVMGAGGLFDVAEEHFGFHHHNEDLGQTLGKYGVGDDLYIVWPVIGPSCLRDTVGLAGDFMMSPLTYVPQDVESRFAFQSGKYLNEVSLSIGEYEDLIKAAIDPYIAVRDAYYQSRREKIKQ